MAERTSHTTEESQEKVTDLSKKTLRNLQSQVCSKLKCEICPELRYTSLRMYDEHLTSKKHLRRKRRKKNESVWYCVACDLVLPNQGEWVKHLVGQRHENSLRNLSVQLRPKTELITPAEIALLDASYEEKEDETIN